MRDPENKERKSASKKENFLLIVTMWQRFIKQNQWNTAERPNKENEIIKIKSLQI